jgi:hypothetical protein
VIWASCFNKYFNVISRLPRLALRIPLDGSDELVSLSLLPLSQLVVTVTQCGCCFSPLLSLLAPLLAPLSVALVSAPNHSWAHLSAALHKNSLGGNVEEYFCGLWLVTVKLVYQGLIVSVKPERRDDIGMADPGSS